MDNTVELSDSPPRSPAAALVEIIAMSMFLSAFGVAVVGACGIAQTDYLRWAQQAGKYLLENHLGWALGAYITTLLAFYGFVIGGQIIADPQTISKTRRVLALVAELVAASLIPSLALAVVASVAIPRLIGGLFLAFPAVALVWFLATRLGTFLVPDLETRRRVATENKNRALGELAKLRSRSRRPVWQVLVVTVLGAAVLAVLSGVFLTRSPEGLAILALVAAVVAAGLSGANLLVVHSFRISLDASTRSAVVLLWLMPHALVVVPAWQLFTSRSAARALGAGLIALVVLLILAAAPVVVKSTALNDWTVYGAAVRSAAQTAVKQLRAAQRELETLPQPPSPGGSPLRERLRAAAAAFRAPV